MNKFYEFLCYVGIICGVLVVLGFITFLTWLWMYSKGMIAL